MEGISFDRASEYYDATRALPPETGQAVADLLSAELAGRGRCLEVGIGTGRVSLPLHERGIPLLGVDLSGPMLARLVANAGGRQPFPLVRGDAIRLPFRDGSAGAVLLSHILHLVPDWPRALGEFVRVLRSGGVVLVDFGGGVPGPWQDAAEDVMRAHGIQHLRPGVSHPDEVSTALGAGSRCRPLPPVSIETRRTLASDLDDWERQIYAWTWPYQPEQMAEACAEIRAWARGAGLDLHEEVTLTRVIQWWAFDVRA